LMKATTNKAKDMRYKVFLVIVTVTPHTVLLWNVDEVLHLLELHINSPYLSQATFVYRLSLPTTIISMTKARLKIERIQLVSVMEHEFS